MYCKARLIGYLSGARARVTAYVACGISHLLAGGLVVPRRRGGLAGLAHQVGEHGAGARPAALVRAARPTLCVPQVYIVFKVQIRNNFLIYVLQICFGEVFTLH